jgi:opacity protein-like surface antigen
MRLKNLFYFLATIVFLSFTAHAQETKFGIKAGVNFSNISSDLPDYSSDMKLGFHIGGGVSLGLTDNFAITADLLYDMKGAQQKITESYTAGSASVKRTSKEKLTISYIEIPVLARYNLESGLYFNAGPYIGFLAGFKDEEDVTQSSTENGVTTNTSSSTSSTDHTGWSSSDFGLKFGLGYKMESGLDLGLNYSLGLSNLIDVEGNPYKAHNNVISITIGYWFGAK